MKFGVEQIDNWNKNSEGVQLQYLTLFNHSMVGKSLSSSRPPVSLVVIDVQLLRSFSAAPSYTIQALNPLLLCEKRKF